MELSAATYSHVRSSKAYFDQTDYNPYEAGLFCTTTFHETEG